MTDASQNTMRILERLIAAYEDYFDVTSPFALGDTPFDAMAAFHQECRK